MVTLRLPSALRPFAGGQKEIQVSGDTVSAAMESLYAQYPALRAHLTDGNGKLRPFVNLFIGENNIMEGQGLETALADGERILLIPSIAGG